MHKRNQPVCASAFTDLIHIVTVQIIGRFSTVSPFHGCQASDGHQFGGTDNTVRKRAVIREKKFTVSGVFQKSVETVCISVSDVIAKTLLFFMKLRRIHMCEFTATGLFRACNFVMNMFIFGKMFKETAEVRCGHLAYGFQKDRDLFQKNLKCHDGQQINQCFPLVFKNGLPE